MALDGYTDREEERTILRIWNGKISFEKSGRKQITCVVTLYIVLGRWRVGLFRGKGEIHPESETVSADGSSAAGKAFGWGCRFSARAEQD
jgi:hypothetical protein